MGDGQQGPPTQLLPGGMLQRGPEPEQQEGICRVTTHLKRQTNKQTKIPHTLPSTSSAQADSRSTESSSQNSTQNKIRKRCSSWECFWTAAGNTLASVREQGLPGCPGGWFFQAQSISRSLRLLSRVLLSNLNHYLSSSLYSDHSNSFPHHPQLTSEILLEVWRTFLLSGLIKELNSKEGSSHFANEKSNTGR